MSRTNSAHWASVKEVGAAWGIRTLLVIYRLFGRTLLFLALYPVVVYFFLTNSSARAASRDYLRTLAAFAPEVSLRPGLRSIFRHFMSFAVSIYDRVAAWTGRVTLDDLTFTGRDALVALMDRGQGAVLLTAHLGSVEVCRAMSRQRANMRLNVLVHTQHAEKINRAMQAVNPNQNVELIEVTTIDPGVAIRLRQKIEAGEFVVVMGDRVPISSTRTIDVDFLGRPAAFPQGPFILASLLKCPVLTLICLAEGRGFHVYIEQLADRVALRRGSREGDLYEYVRAYAQRLEVGCRRAPLQWFNFFPFWRD
jgi:predicted LPLAT superfamily acyltransferase